MWTYEVDVNWKEGKIGEMLSEGKPTVEVATPPEFGGPNGIWTPEDLITSSVATCIMTSALFFFNRSKIGLEGYKSKAVGTLEKTSKGLVMTEIKVTALIKLVDASQADAALKAMEQAEKTCPLSNSLTCPVTLNVEITNS
jgi:organic hydroperoxide reductase OsmC/OhrA